MSWQVDLHNQISSVCPITSIRFVDINTKFTWEIIYKPEATKDQKIKAEDIINKFDMSLIKTEEPEIEQLKKQIDKLTQEIDNLKNSSLKNKV